MTERNIVNREIIARLRRSAIAQATYQFFDVTVTVKSPAYSDITTLNHIFRAFPAKEGNLPHITFYLMVDEPNISFLQSLLMPYLSYCNRTIYYEKDGRYEQWLYPDTPLPPFAISPLKGAYFLVHGCAVVTENNKGLIFPAPSMSGKTTLTLELVRRGLKCLSDDLLVIDPNTLHILPYPKPVGIREKTLELIKGLTTRLESQDVHKLCLGSMDETKVWLTHIDDIYPNCLSELTQINVIIFPQQGSNRKPELVKIPKIQAVLTLLRNTCNSGYSINRSIETSASIVKKAKCFSLFSCNIEETVDCILDLVDNLEVYE